MSSYNTISSDKLARLVGTAKAPTLVDVRIDDDFAADPRLIPGAVRRSYRDVQEWAPQLAGQSPVVVICQKGKKLSEGAAAWLRQSGIAAESLEGGHARLGRDAEAGRSRRQDTRSATAVAAPSG